MFHALNALFNCKILLQTDGIHAQDRTGGGLRTPGEYMFAYVNFSEFLYVVGGLMYCLCCMYTSHPLGPTHPCMSLCLLLILTYMSMVS